MSLISCIECDYKISDQALACPNCGMPNKHSKNTIKLSNSIESIQNTVISSQNFFTKSFFFSTKGRINRGQYVIGSILLFIAFITISLIFDYFTNSLLRNCFGYSYYECMSSIVIIGFILKIPFFILFLYSSITLSVKRFHDFSKSGYSVFLLAIPIVGFYYLWLLLSTKSDDYKNLYDNS